eukprot:CAMPEP_0178981940 /NCGR_PEP_ID=MMETSP0795-20121207/223_1 /TAXON_ID=88552 /ORGANISM="Amoebophrya sp., Strain Ameob2" /LENGTH=1858 /DNA_ID=CAMNT_0020672537 /DNA_START=108 /DNA_END=5681 /DNA_ORIENTATION=-
MSLLIYRASGDVVRVPVGQADVAYLPYSPASASPLQASSPGTGAGLAIATAQSASASSSSSGSSGPHGSATAAGGARASAAGASASTGAENLFSAASAVPMPAEKSVPSGLAASSSTAALHQAAAGSATKRTSSRQLQLEAGGSSSSSAFKFKAPTRKKSWSPASVSRRPLSRTLLHQTRNAFVKNYWRAHAGVGGSTATAAASGTGAGSATKLSSTPRAHSSKDLRGLPKLLQRRRPGASNALGGRGVGVGLGEERGGTAEPPFSRPAVGAGANAAATSEDNSATEPANLFDDGCASDVIDNLVHRRPAPISVHRNCSSSPTSPRAAVGAEDMDGLPLPQHVSGDSNADEPRESAKKNIAMATEEVPSPDERMINELHFRYNARLYDNPLNIAGISRERLNEITFLHPAGEYSGTQSGLSSSSSVSGEDGEFVGGLFGEGGRHFGQREPFSGADTTQTQSQGTTRTMSIAGASAVHDGAEEIALGNEDDPFPNSETCFLTVKEARMLVAEKISQTDGRKVPVNLCYFVDVDSEEGSIMKDEEFMKDYGFTALLVIQTKDYLQDGKYESLSAALLHEEDLDTCYEIVYQMEDEELNQYTAFDKDVQTHLLYDVTRNTKTRVAKTYQALAIVDSGRFRFPRCDLTHGREGYYDNILVAIIRVLGWNQNNHHLGGGGDAFAGRNGNGMAVIAVPRPAAGAGGNANAIGIGAAGAAPAGVQAGAAGPGRAVAVAVGNQQLQRQVNAADAAPPQAPQPAPPPRPPNGREPLTVADRLVKICSLILESPYTNKPDLLVNKLSDVNETALMLAVRCKNFDLFELIVEHSVAENVATELLQIRENIGGKETAFLFAAREGCPKIFNYLLQNAEKLQIDINQKSDYGLNAFLFAASNNQVEICKMLMQCPGFGGVNDVCRDGCNALLYACSHYGSIQMCRLLLEGKVRIPVATGSGTPGAGSGFGGGDDARLLGVGGGAGTGRDHIGYGGGREQQPTHAANTATTAALDDDAGPGTEDAEIGLRGEALDAALAATAASIEAALIDPGSRRNSRTVTTANILGDAGHDTNRVLAAQQDSVEREEEQNRPPPGKEVAGSSPPTAALRPSPPPTAAESAEKTEMRSLFGVDYDPFSEYEYSPEIDSTPGDQRDAFLGGPQMELLDDHNEELQHAAARNGGVEHRRNMEDARREALRMHENVDRDVEERQAEGEGDEGVALPTGSPAPRARTGADSDRGSSSSHKYRTPEANFRESRWQRRRLRNRDGGLDLDGDPAKRAAEGGGSASSSSSSGTPSMTENATREEVGVSSPSERRPSQQAWSPADPPGGQKLVSAAVAVGSGRSDEPNQNAAGAGSVEQEHRVVYGSHAPPGFPGAGPSTTTEEELEIDDRDYAVSASPGVAELLRRGIGREVGGGTGNNQAVTEVQTVENPLLLDENRVLENRSEAEAAATPNPAAAAPARAGPGDGVATAPALPPPVDGAAGVERPGLLALPAGNNRRHADRQRGDAAAGAGGIPARRAGGGFPFNFLGNRDRPPRRYRIQQCRFINPFQGFNACDNDGRNGFLRAIRSGYGGATKALLQYLIKHSEKFDPGFLDAADKDGNNAFHQAIYRCSIETVELLLRYKHKFRADFISVKNNGGNNALLLAASFSEPITRMILEEESFHGANEKNQEGVNAFLRAASMGRMDICRLLYSHKQFDREGINEVDRHGNNALLLSAGYGNAAICNFLLNGEAKEVFTHSINSMNNRGDSLLIVSAENGYSEFCRTLSADPEFALHYHRNTEGVTALLAAARRGYVGVCEFFVLEERYRGQLEVTDNLGNNAFLYAASSFRFAEDLERVFFNTGAGADGAGTEPAVAGVNMLQDRD